MRFLHRRGVGSCVLRRCGRDFEVSALVPGRIAEGAGFGGVGWAQGHPITQLLSLRLGHQHPLEAQLAQHRAEPVEVAADLGLSGLWPAPPTGIEVSQHQGGDVLAPLEQRVELFGQVFELAGGAAAAGLAPLTLFPRTCGVIPVSARRSSVHRRGQNPVHDRV